MDHSGGKAEAADEDEELVFRVGRDPRVPDPGRAARWAAWQAENAEAIESFNRWFDETGHRYLRPPLL